MSNFEHDIAVCRDAYKLCRKHGAPAVAVFNLGSNQFYVEITNGTRRIKHEMVAGRCCKWALKFEIASEWLNKYGETKI